MEHIHRLLALASGDGDESFLDNPSLSLSHKKIHSSALYEQLELEMLLVFILSLSLILSVRKRCAMQVKLRKYIITDKLFVATRMTFEGARNT